MTDSVKKYFSPRLLDYIVIVGTRAPSINQSIQMPQLLRRYPPEDHKDFPLSPDVVFFCQPEGCITTDVRRLSQRDTNSFVFALTEKDTSRVRYGVCINFYRHIELKTPKCSKSYEEETATTTTTTTTAINNDIDDKLIDFTANPKDDALLNRNKSHHRRHISKKCLSLVSLCIISHHPFFSTFRECLIVLKQMILIFSEKNRDKKHHGRDLIWSLLTTKFTSDFTKMIPEQIIEDVREIETWCLRLLSAPVPVPGKTKVELEILDTKIKPALVFALPDHTRFSLVDFPLHLPLELLGVETCIKVMTMIMMEHKIVIQSRDYNALSMSVMAFVTIIYPFEYMFPVIPLLPTCMNSAEQLLLAPTPYIIGVPSSFLFYKKNFKLPDDVWLVDLDSNKIIKPTGIDELPQLPEPEGSTLKNHFKQVLASMSIQNPAAQSLSNTDITKTNVLSSDPNSKLPFDPLNYGNDIDLVDIAARIAMIKFFNSNGLLLNFSEFTRIIRLFPRPVVAFQTNSFLHSRPKSSVFLTKFVQTQAVEFFAEWSLCPDNVAFIRVQNGVYDPSIIGDKPKWYSHQLDTIHFRAWSSGTRLEQFFANADQEDLTDSDDDDDDDDNNGENDDSEDDISTSSSLSSLNEFVQEMCDANKINSVYLTSLRDQTNSSFTLCDLKTVFHPPDSLQYITSSNTGNDSEQKTSPKLSKASSDTSDSESSSSVRSDSDSDDVSQHEFKTTSIYEKSNIELPDMSQIQPEKIVKRMSESDNDVSQNSASKTLDHIQSGLVHTSDSSNANLSSSNSVDKSSETSTPTLIKTMSISSVFSRSQSQHRDSFSAGSSGASFFDRITNEAKDMAREAKAVAKEVVSKPSAQAGRKKFLAKLQDLSDPMKNSAREFWRSSRDEDSSNNILPASAVSKIGSMPNDFNGLADKTAGMISGFFSKSNLAKVTQKTQPFGPFPIGKKGLVEKSNLIKHSSNQNQLVEQKTQSHSDNQSFLKESINAVIDGEGIGWLKLSRLKKLMEDEQYRSSVLQHLNKILPRKISPDDHIEDLQISKNTWKGLLKILKAMIYGLEQNYFHHGSSNGMASAFGILEIAHTHYWIKEMSSEDKISMTATPASGSPSLTPYDSTENLASIAINNQGKKNSMTETETRFEKAQPPTKAEILNEDKKNSLLMGQLVSFESELSDVSPSQIASDTASLTVIPNFGSKLPLGHSIRSTCSDSEIEGLQGGRQTRTPSVWSSKSSISAGFRYHGGALVGSIPMEVQRFYLFEGISGNNRSNLWDQMQFWEDIFLDAVSQERDLIGMDQGPGEMMDRYRNLVEIDKKRLEHEEDRLLATFLYNMAAFMIMVNVDRTEIKRKCRRLLGKCHIGLVYSAEINEVLDQIDFLHGNDIDLKPLSTRQIHQQTFTVHMGTDNEGDMMFMEVRDDGLILRSINGIIIERWWYERLVNMTYSPKNKVLCLWRRNGAHTQLHKYYTKKCKDLYYCIKDSMERAVQSGTGTLPGTELGGEFPVQDMKSGEGGLLQVCMEGVGMLFANSQDFFLRWSCSDNTESPRWRLFIQNRDRLFYVDIDLKWLIKFATLFSVSSHISLLVSSNTNVVISFKM
ncbi:hypothetical protein NH340_JMT05501 [Sarcoptes scabiei]|nr:hypothetical protein NH340_JMT05501 [Sarcoptes scabiei]